MKNSFDNNSRRSFLTDQIIKGRVLRGRPFWAVVRDNSATFRLGSYNTVKKANLLLIAMKKGEAK